MKICYVSCGWMPDCDSRRGFCRRRDDRTGWWRAPCTPSIRCFARIERDRWPCRRAQRSAVCTGTDREQHPAGIDASRRAAARTERTREFLTEICNLMKNLVGLDEKSASLTARIVLCSAVVDALSIAPALVITGPDTARASRLVTLLRCLCWHSIPLTSVTPASFCSLASGVRFTFLISQASVSDKLRKLLDDASRP